MADGNGNREEIFSKAVRAGKRTYFFDVKSTKGNDLYLTITESKKRFRKVLLNLSQRIHTTLWLHPRLKRGMRHLLPQLAEGTSVRLLALD